MDARKLSTDGIGSPFSFTSGSFGGRTIRALLTLPLNGGEAASDAALRLQLFNVTNYGTSAQYESEIEDYDLVDITPLLAYVDLFPATEDGSSLPSLIPYTMSPSMALSPHAASSPRILLGAHATHDSIGGPGAVSEEDKLVSELIGGTFSMVTEVVREDRTILTVSFNALSIQVEGRFWARFRVIDILSTTLELSEIVPVLAEAYGWVSQPSPNE